jgi:tight adherence protein B
LSKDIVVVILFSVFILCMLGCVLVLIRLYVLNTQSRLRSRVNSLVDVTINTDEQLSQGSAPKSYFLSRGFEGIRGKINRALSFFSTEELRLRITSANWPISDIEFIISRIVISLVGLLLGWIISQSIIGGLGLAILLYLIPGIYLDQAIAKRRRQFQDQLIDFLVLIRGAVLVGSSLQQALSVGIKEIPAPISEEFGQVLREIKFGLSLPDALHNMEARMQSPDLKIVVTGIIINAQMGGNLSTILDSATTTIRDRMQLFGEVRSLTAYSRYVGLLMTLTPFFMGVLIYLSNPRFYDPVKTSPLVQLTFILAFLGILVGNFFLRRLMRIRI